MKVLFVNACMRGEKSRTLKLCRAYLEKLQQAFGDATIEEVDLTTLDVEVQDGDYIQRRDVLLRAGDFSHPMFDLAKQFIAADHVVIG
ncbi:MAG: NAD(P)H-dependent oxidoreductase, partial [Firmicutes bacterium]|nr:NAD(P)H-dependent oxidoreductase [Bacillota bacterium]